MKIFLITLVLVLTSCFPVNSQNHNLIINRSDTLARRGKSKVRALIIENLSSSSTIDKTEEEATYESHVAAPFPTASQIEEDLVGRTISEGTPDGYHKADWTFTIQRGQINNLTISVSSEPTPRVYVAEVKLHLQPDANFYYDTTLKVHYIKNAAEQWKLDTVISLGMTVVSDGSYDNCITARIGEDGWGGTYCLYLRNSSDSSLIVGGRVHTDNGWKCFSSIVPGHDETSVGGLFGGGSVNNYLIDFVVKEY